MKVEYTSDVTAYRRWRRSKFREQKIMGWAMVALNFIVPTGAAVLLVPLGLWMAFSKEIVIY